MLKEDNKLKSLPAHIKGYIDSAKPTISVSGQTLLITLNKSHAYSKDWFEESIPHLNEAYGTSSCEIHIAEQAVTDVITSHTIDHTMVHTIDEFKELITILDSLEEKVIAIDFETTSINTYKAKILGIGISIAGANYYIPIHHAGTDLLPIDYIMQKLKGPLERSLLIAHNTKYELKILGRYGVNPTKFYDTMLAAYLEDSSKPKGLKALVKRTFFNEMTDLGSLITDARKKLRASMPLKEYSKLIRSVTEDMKDSIFLERIPLDDLGRYCAEDAYYTLRLYNHYKDMFDESNQALLDQDHRLLAAVIKMENNGVLLDTTHFSRLSSELPTKLDEIYVQLCAIAGHEFNIASSKQLGEVLYTEMDVAGGPLLTDKGNYQTDEKTLKFLAASTQEPRHVEFLNLILKYRELNKLITTYLKLPELIEETTGRLHGSFNSCGTTTGRFSSQRPNMQNLPKSGLGKGIRQGIIAPEGFTLIAPDYSQIELRILANLTRDPMLINAFNKGDDIHALIASRVFDIPLEEVTDHQRNIGKTGNFAAIYGSGTNKFSETTGLSKSKSKEFMDKYFEELPNLKQLIEDTVRGARSSGFVETLKGRRRYIQGLDSQVRWKKMAAERECFNAIIQGTAADIMRIAIINVNNWLTSEVPEAKIIMTVHDELVIEVPDEHLDYVTSSIKSIMEWPKEFGCEELYPEISVPLAVDVGSGINYAECK